MCWNLALQRFGQTDGRPVTAPTQKDGFRV